MLYINLLENRILRRIFGPKRDENEQWRRLHNAELHCLYRSPKIIRVIKSIRLRWAGRSAFKNLTGNPTGKITLGIPRSRWGETILEWILIK